MNLILILKNTMKLLKDHYLENILEYTKRCFQSNSMDFDDLLVKTNELLNKFPENWLNIKTDFDLFWLMSIKTQITHNI